MLYLIINEKGEPEQRWAIDPAVEFAGLVVKGPAFLGGDGKPVPSEILELDQSGNVRISATKKAALEQAAANEIAQNAQKLQQVKTAFARLKNSSSQDVSDLLILLKHLSNRLDSL